MSSNHKYILELSHEAYDDLVNIQNYTFTKYGEKGWVNYGADLDHALLHIQNHPFTGHTRQDIPENYLTWNVNEHVLIYRLEENTIYLVRVLHRKMNFKLQFTKG